jgi:hypothetical protein
VLPVEGQPLKKTGEITAIIGSERRLFLLWS